MTDEVRSLRLRAIVLRHTDYAEADRILTLLTPQWGKVSAIARGVRRFNSRKAGHLQPFNCIQVQLTRGKGSLWVVDQVTTLRAFPGICECLERTVRASWVTELAERFTPEWEPNDAVFRLTLETLERIETAEQPLLPQLFFDLRLLDHTGYRPELRRCLGCHEEVLPEKQYFSNENGGVLCPTCGAAAFGTSEISLEALRMLRNFQLRPYRELLAYRWPAAACREAESLLNSYFAYLLDRKPNTQKFYESL